MKIIVDMAGGFGNQLFCYAFGYALSKELDAEFWIDTTMQDSGIARGFDLGNLNITYDKQISYPYKRDMLNRALFNKLHKKMAIGFNTRIYNETAPTDYDSQVFSISKDTFFKGNWQTEKYFKNYRDELLNRIIPKESSNNSVETLINEISKVESVSIHVRRGDYVQIGCNLGMDYYDTAIQIILNKYNDAVFYIFSDDTEFCKSWFAKYIGKLDIRYPEYESTNTTVDDLWIMSNCKHNIIANSSFSWWAAWLNQNSQKLVVCPELGMWANEFYPEEWEKIQIEEHK